MFVAGTETPWKFDASKTMLQNILAERPNVTCHPPSINTLQGKYEKQFEEGNTCLW